MVFRLAIPCGLCYTVYDENAFKYAHERGIIVNVFWSDDLEEAKKLISWGADCILSNRYQTVAELDEGIKLI